MVHPQTDRHNLSAQRYLALNCVGEIEQRWLTSWMIEDKMAGMVEIIIGDIQARSFQSLIYLQREWLVVFRTKAEATRSVLSP